MRISDWSSDVCSSDLASATWAGDRPSSTTRMVRLMRCRLYTDFSEDRKGRRPLPDKERPSPLRSLPESGCSDRKLSRERRVAAIGRGTVGERGRRYSEVQEGAERVKKKRTNSK